MTEKSNDQVAKLAAGFPTKAARPRVLSVSIRDVRTLTAAFMPFLKKGGLFVPTETDYAMGDEVFLVLKLLESEQFAVAGTVAWLTPSGAQSSRTKGIGVHFKGADGQKLNERIEELIKGVASRRSATHTL